MNTLKEQVGGWTSYKFRFSTTVLPGPWLDIARWPFLQGVSICLRTGRDFDLGKKKNFSIFGVEVIEKATSFVPYPSLLAYDIETLNVLKSKFDFLRFGRLVVKFKSGKTPKGTTLYFCLCDCGKFAKASAGNLRSGAVRSCGCLRREHALRVGIKGRQLRSKPGSLFRQLLAHCKAGAKRRNLSFSLTDEQFSNFSKGDCFYCGVEARAVYRPTRYKECYLYNGIDRVDNSAGYEFINCVSCCKHCNQFKSNMTKEEMFGIVKNIYERHIGRKE